MPEKIQRIKNLIKSDYLISVFATGVHAVLIFVYGIFVRHFVLPKDYGLYTTANIVLTYLNFLQLGVLNSFNRDYPQAAGANDDDRMQALKNTTFTYISLSYFVIGSVVGIVVQIIAALGKIDVKIANGICLICLIALLSNCVSICTTKYKAHGDFFLASIINVISTLVQVVVGGLFVYCLGYYGIYIALILFSLTSIVLMKNQFKTFRFWYDTKLLLIMIKTGIPLLINGLIWTLIMTSDQFIILYFSDSEKLGLYSVAQTIFSVMVLIPQTVSQVMYVKLSNYYGMTRDEEKLLKVTEKNLLVITIINCTVMMVVYTIIPMFVQVFMPAYVDGGAAAQVLCIGVAIYGGTMVYGNLFTILKKNKQLLRATSCLCIANVLFSCLLVLQMGFKLELVAYGTAISYTVYSLILVINTSKLFKKSFWGLAFKSYLLILISIVAIVLINTVISRTVFRYTVVACLIGTLLLGGFFVMKKRLLNGK